MLLSATSSLIAQSAAPAGLRTSAIAAATTTIAAAMMAGATAAI